MAAPILLFRRIENLSAALAFMIHRAFLALALGLAISPAAADPRNLQLVPEGWYSIQSHEDDGTQKYVSPDGRSFLTLGDADARLHDVAAEMDKIAHQPGETITYQKSERSWIVVSGYRNNEIFYRRANLACAGTRWHMVELRYPRPDKRRMDAIVSTVSHRVSQFHDVCPPRANRQ
jgi:hypothetical protein